MDPLQTSNALCLKRKPADDCLAKNFKSHRVERENASSKPAHSCRSQPNLATDCINYLKSGVPSHVVFYRQGSWCNFPDEVVNSIVDAFKEDKSSVVVVMDDQPLLVDFLSMTLVNLKTRKQRSIAWLDETNKWSFPSSFFDEGVDESTRLGTGAVKSGAEGFVGCNVTKSPSDAAKQVMLEANPPVLQNSSVLDILRKKIVHLERGSESFMFVQNLFLSGMGSFAVPNNILHIHRYSPKDITAQCELEAFERQMRLTGQKSGNAIARYGWLGSGKQDIVSVIANGFLSTEKVTRETEIGTGVYLSPEDRAFTSVGFCDVDEKGVQYMLLCRAILGNKGVIKPGSQEKFLCMYDSGVDNCSNPNYYVVWPSHLGTHISLEYLISFRLAPKVQEYMLSLKGLWLRPPPKEVNVDLSILQPVLCQTDEGPTSPWISFRVLFETIQDSVSVLARELLYRHYEELKENKITRVEMVKRMMIIVGEELLLDTLTKLKYSASLWYSSSAKMACSPASTAPEFVSIGTRNTYIESATPSPDGHVWDSAGASMEHDCHDPLSLSSYEGHGSDVSRPTLGNSASPGMEGLHSGAPCMTAEAHEAPAPSSAHGNSLWTDSECIGAETPGIESQVYAPSAVPQFSAAKSMVPPELGAPRSIAHHLSLPRSTVPHLRGKAARELSAPRSMPPHLSAPRSMAPHLCGKIPKVPEKINMPYANYSSAAIVVPVIFEAPPSSPLPKENCSASKECVMPSLVRQGPDCPANLATKLHSPILKNVVLKNPAAQFGANETFPRLGVDESSTTVCAAATLITLSADGEKGL